MYIIRALILLPLLSQIHAAEGQIETPVQKNDAKSHKFSGNASWYGAQFHGKKTASGEPFNMYKLTAAHRKLPIPTRVLVEEPSSGKAVIVRVNDRGPFAKGRVMDLSREAARQLGTLGRGVFYIEALVLAPAVKPSSPNLSVPTTE